MRKQTIAILASILLLCSVVAFLLTRSVEVSQAKSDPPELPAASVVRVVRGPISDDLRIAGQFTPYQEVDLHAKVSGYIRRINVDIGDRVRAGQTIATLEIPELNAQLAGAQAEVRHGEAEIVRSRNEITRAEASYAAIHAAFTRLQQAARQRPGLIAQQELDDAQARDQNAQARIDVSKAALDATQQQLGVAQAGRLRVKALADYSVVTSPFNGVITMRYADTGALIQAGTASNTQAMPIVRVAQSDLLRLRIPVPESDVRYIEPGARVQVTVHALNRVFEAKVVRFTRAMDLATRTMQVEADVPNGDLTLNPGMYADTSIVLQHRNDILSLPAQAVIQESEQRYVLALDRANRVERHNVQLGIEGRNRIEIVSGLSDGDLVILSGQPNYQNGEAVRPRIVSPDSDTQRETGQ